MKAEDIKGTIPALIYALGLQGDDEYIDTPRYDIRVFARNLLRDSIKKLLMAGAPMSP